MDLRNVSVITRNIVASRTEADLLNVVCAHLVNSCGAEAVAIWLTHRAKGMVTARPDHWFSNRIPIQQQPLVIDQNHLVGGLRGTGPYLKQIHALPPIDMPLQYIAAPLVFDGGIRGLVAAWALPNTSPGLPDLIDLASQLTAVRLRALTDQTKLSEQQESIRSTQQELHENRRHFLLEEQAATSGYLAALIGQSWQGPLLESLQALEKAEAALAEKEPLAMAGITHAHREMQVMHRTQAQLAAILQSDPEVADLTRPDLSINLMGLAAKLCLRNGFKLAWSGPEQCFAASRSGGPAIFRAVLLEIFGRMKSDQSLNIHFQITGEHCLWGFYVDTLSPELAAWVQNGTTGSEPDSSWSSALQIASMLTRQQEGLLRCTARNQLVKGAVLRLPVRMIEGG